MSVRSIGDEGQPASYAVQDNTEAPHAQKLIYFVTANGTPLFKCDTFAEATRVKKFLELVPAFAVDI